VRYLLVASRAIVRLTNLSVKVMGLFEITKLEKLLEIFQTEGEAIAAFK
jgi:hypothetical protein